MTFIDDFVEDTRSWQRYFRHQINPRVYDQMRKALPPFKAIGDRLVAEGIRVVTIPIRESMDELLAHKSQVVSALADINDSVYMVVRAIEGLYAPLISKERMIGGAADRKLVLCVDDVPSRIIQHELFHSIEEVMLNDRTLTRIAHLRETAKQKRAYLNRPQRNNPEEYFAMGGEYYLRRRRLLSPHRKLQRKDPGLYELIGEVLAGKDDLFKPPQDS